MRALRGNGWRELVWPSAVALLAMIAYALLVRDHPAPDIYPDEAHYWLVGLSIAEHHSYEWFGVPADLRSLYPFLAAIAWQRDYPDDAYATMKLLNVVVACLTAYPAYALMRRFACRSAAAALTALLLAGAWMTMTGRVMTENLSWPIVTGAFAALVWALSDPRRRRLSWLALGLFALAAAVRAPLAPLLAVVPAAFALEWLRRPRDQRAEWFTAYRAPVIAGAVLVVAGALLALVARNALVGSYADFDPADDTSPGSVLWWIANNLVETSLMVGVIPVVALLCLACSSRAWRDDRSGSFLATAVPAFAIVLLEVGWFEASGTARLIDRYLINLAPLAIAALPAAFGRIRLATALIWTWVLAIFAIALPIPGDPVGEAEALFGTIVRLFGWPESDPEGVLVPLAAAIVLVGSVGGLLLSDRLHERWGSPRARGRIAAVGLAGVLLVSHALAVSSWSWQVADLRSELGRTLLPPDKSWIDHRHESLAETPQPASILLVAPVSYEVPLASAFFNYTLDTAFRLPGVPPGVFPYNGARPTTVGPDGEVQPVAGAPRIASTLLVPGGRTQATFRDERERTWKPELPASLVTVDSSRPTLRSLASAGCVRERPCSEAGSFEIWAQKPGLLRMRYDGAQEPTTMRAGGDRVVLPPGAGGQLTVPVARGRNRIAVTIEDRVTERNARELVAATLREGRSVTRIYSAVPRRGDRDLAQKIPR